MKIKSKKRWRDGQTDGVSEGMPSVNATWLSRCSKSPMAMGVSTTETSRPMFDFHGSGTLSVRWLPRSLVRVSPSCRSTRRYNKQNRTHLVIQQSLPCLSVCVCVCVPPSGGRPDPWSESRPVVALRGATTSRTERT